MYKNSNPNSISLMQRERLGNGSDTADSNAKVCDICLTPLDDIHYCIIDNTHICTSCIAKVIEHQLKTALPNLNRQISDITDFAIKREVIKKLLEEVL